MEEEICYHTALYMIAQSDIALKLRKPQCCFSLIPSTSVLDSRAESSLIMMDTNDAGIRVLLVEQSPLNSNIIIMMIVMRLRL